MRAPSLLFAFALHSLTLSSPAWAGSPSARLAYARGMGAESCPDEAALRAAVAQRFGYSPFFPHAPQSVIVQIDKRPSGFEARVQLLDERGVVRGERLLPVQEDCEDAVAAAALSVSLALTEAAEADAESAEARREPEPEPEPAPAPAPPPAPRTDRLDVDRATEVRPATPIAGLVWAGGGASVGATPAAGPIVFVGGGVRRGPLSIGLEGMWNAPTERDVGRAFLSTSTLAITLAPCGHLGVAFVCVGGGVGRLASETRGILQPGSDGAAIALLVARAGIELPVTDAFAVRLFAEARATLNPPEVAISGVTVYESPAMAGLVGAAPVLRF